MPAHKQEFPWPSYYGHFNFFEQRMAAHHKVAGLDAKGGGLYELTLGSGEMLLVFICECYSFGVAEYTESVQKLGALNAVIIHSNWCGYTTDAKRHCREEHVGLFNIRDLMAALNRPDFWAYLNEGEKELFRKKGWL
jgi:hypothetical protein